MTDTLARVRELLPELAKRADEIERAGDIPAAATEQLASAGCLRMMTPVEYGGSGMRMPDVLRVLAELAQADASVAWVVGQVALAQLIVRSCPGQAIGEVFGDGPDVFVAGAVAPKGRTKSSTGGWRVTGQWPFVTGCRNAKWFYLNCLVVDGRSVRTTPSGGPMTRIVLLPAAEVTVIDNWDVLGLCGTGSHDVLVTRAACPPWRGFSLRDGERVTVQAAADIAQSSLIIGAVAVGIAAGALDNVVDLAAGGKRPALAARRLAASAVVQDRLGEAHTVLESARALLLAEAEVAWQRANGERLPNARQRAQTRAAAAQVTGLSRQVVDTAYALAGGTAVYDGFPLQRRMRDMHTATQHFVAGREAYRTLGAMLVGEQVDTGPF